jgi:hypothetical protein
LFRGLLLFVNRERNDDELKRALQSWTVDPKIPPNFAPAVWDRIAAGEKASPGWNSWVTFLQNLSPVAGSRLALTAATLGLVSGIFAGVIESKQLNLATQQELAVKYVRSVDPYQQVSSL